MAKRQTVAARTRRSVAIGTQNRLAACAATLDGHSGQLVDLWLELAAERKLRLAGFESARLVAELQAGQLREGLSVLEVRLAASHSARCAAENQLRASIADERTHRLKLAEEQRAYVDREDGALRKWLRRLDDDVTALAPVRHAEDGAPFTTFAGRLRWLFTGK